jgi:hypothetical protein
VTAPPPPHDPANPWSAPVPPPQHPTAWPAAPEQDDGPGYARQASYAIPGQPGAHGLPPGAYLYAPPPPSRLKGLGMTTVVLLGIQAVLAAAAAGVSAWGVLSWSRVSGASADVQLRADQADLLLTVLRAPLGALTGIAFVAWVWIATRNARNAGARVRHAPGWALGGWVVPILNLWRPKQMIDDLWRASMPGVATGIDLRFVRKPVSITCWWAAYLIGTSLPAVAITKAMMAVLIPNLDNINNGLPPSVAVDMARINETTAMYNLWAAVLMVVAAGLAMHFVLRITQWQDDRTTPLRGHLPHELGATT